MFAKHKIILSWRNPQLNGMTVPCHFLPHFPGKSQKPWIIKIFRNRLGCTCTLILGAGIENFVASPDFSIYCDTKSVKEPKMHLKTDLDMKLRIWYLLEFFDASFVYTTIFKIILWFSVNFVLWRPPVDTGRKLNLHKTFRRRPGRFLNV